MSLTLGYLDGSQTKRIHVNEYNKKEHGGRVFCAFGHPLIGKQGTKVRWHFSHTGKYDDDCSRKMGPWHTWWQNRIEDDFLEIIVLKDVNGKRVKHIADAINCDDVVVEFQKSVVPPETIQERESFYNNMIWVFCLTKHLISPLYIKGSFVRFQLLGGSKYFLEAKEKSFLDFDKRGLIEVLEVKTGRSKSKPIIYGKVWTLEEFDHEFMSECLKEDADIRFYNPPYSTDEDCDDFSMFKKLCSAKFKK